MTVGMTNKRPTPLRETSGPESGEAQMICALVETGEFKPAKYGLSVDDCETWIGLWNWCERYQQETDEAPTPTMLRLHHPEFVYTPGVPVKFAAAQLARESEIRKMKFAVRAALAELGNEDVDAARTALAHIHASRALGKAGDSIWTIPDEDNAVRRLVPYPALGKVTGGMGNGELWYLAAPSGAGKTMVACEYVAGFLEQGLNIEYLSCEVPTYTINRRVRRCLATPEELKLLDAKHEGEPDRRKVLAAIEMQKARIPGSLHVYDPSHGRVTPATVRRHMDQADLVVVDHIGLMYTQDGRRAVDDWRAYATISNSLMEDKLASGTSVLAVAQLNRSGDEGDDEKPPKVTSIGGAYQLVQDGDVVITMKRSSESVMVHGCEKNREGASAMWYSHYDVAKANFSQITRDQALEIISRDQESKYR